MGWLTNEHFVRLNIWAEVERHTSTRLHPARSGKQANGACPYDDCSADENGFMVFPQMTPLGNHFYCRTCRRAGDLVKLIRDIKGISYRDACNLLDIPSRSNGNLGARKEPVKPSALRKPSEAEKQEMQELLAGASAGSGTLQHERARDYLAQRGISLELAEACNLWYVSPSPQRITKWGDRIVFPLLTPEGQQTFAGRSLFLWKPGMDETEHKATLDTYNEERNADNGIQVPRWRYPYLNGLFNWQVVSSADLVVLVEGAFDALALMEAGITNVVAMGGKAIDARHIPGSICDVVLGMDADAPGKEGAAKLAKDLRRAGISVEIRVPVQGKDWSEAWRLRSHAGIAPLLSAQHEGMADAEPTLSESDDLASHCCLCGAEPWTTTDENKSYCKACWRAQGHGPADDAKCCVCGDFIDVVGDDGRAWCQTHYDAMMQGKNDTVSDSASSPAQEAFQQPQQDDTMSQEEVTEIANRIADHLPGTWTIAPIHDLEAYKQRIIAETHNVYPLCRFCKASKWMWSAEDEDRICMSCLSPMNKPVTLHKLTVIPQLSRRAPFPDWLILGTPAWKKEEARVGTEALMERRQVALQQAGRS